MRFLSFVFLVLFFWVGLVACSGSGGGIFSQRKLSNSCSEGCLEPDKDRLQLKVENNSPLGVVSAPFTVSGSCNEGGFISKNNNNVDNRIVWSLFDDSGEILVSSEIVGVYSKCERGRFYVFVPFTEIGKISTADTGFFEVELQGLENGTTVLNSGSGKRKLQVTFLKESN